jgi:hypothetical protein
MGGPLHGRTPGPWVSLRGLFAGSPHYGQELEDSGPACVRLLHASPIPRSSGVGSDGQGVDTRAVTNQGAV